MTGTRRKEISNSKQTSTLPPANDRLLRSRSPIVDGTDRDNLSEESRTLLFMLEAKFDSKINELIGLLRAKDEKIEKLEQENANLRRDIGRIVERVDNLETGERRADIIVSGDVLPIENVGENLQRITIDLLKSSLNYELPNSAILSASRLGKPPSADRAAKRNILLKLSGEHIKEDILKSCKSVKPVNLYINENLTPLRAEVLYSLRKLKRKYPMKIEYCGSVRGRVYFWMKLENGQSRNRKLYVDSLTNLEDLCERELNVDISEVRPVSVRA